VSGTETETSPDGRFVATFRLRERMKGQWVATPEVRDCRGDRTVIAFGDDDIDGTIDWGKEPGRFSLVLRRWPGAGGGVSAHFDVDAGTVRLGAAGEARPIAEAEALIGAQFAAQAAATPSPPEEPERRHRLAQVAEWAGIALFLIAGLAVLMGGVG
jgi:hypothetical protein